MLQDAALLLTDLVDSTLLTERLGDEAMSAVWQAHDRVSRDLLVAWNGTEINRSDGFLLRFNTVADAAAYATIYHRELARLTPPLRARAGLHFGSVIERHNLPSDLMIGAKSLELAGMAIPTVGRLMALALPQQTLMTAAARGSLGASRLKTISHGYWRFKGIDEPAEIFEIGDDLAPFAPPTDVAKCFQVVRSNRHWIPVRDIPHTLPAERNEFIGRERDLRIIDEKLLHGSRLVTVSGPGGTGKTRLMQHYGWRALGDFAGGVWYCDLSQATTFDGVCGAVAQGLGIPLGSGDPVALIGEALAGRGECLVILDNFEQVVAHALASIGPWLDRSAGTRFVVTSRMVLGLDGEDVVALPQLSVQEGADLFACRAAAARGSFPQNPASSAQIARLVALLDGMPLAIELAAVRMRVFDLASLVERMHDRFALLTSAGGRPSRQATLRATLDWSWDLLSPIERRVAVQLSVFEGGFTLAAIEAIVRCAGDAVEVLQALVEKSWVEHAAGTRFGMLRSMQDYLLMRLAEARASTEVSDDVGCVEQRHGDYYGVPATDDVESDWIADLDNIVVAVRRAIAGRRATAAAAALLQSWNAIKLCGPYRSAIELATGVLQLDGLSPDAETRARFVEGHARQLSGDDRGAMNAYAAGLECARAADDRAMQARILCGMAELRTIGRAFDEAALLLDEAVTLALQLGDQELLCAAHNARGTRAQRSGRHDDAIAAFGEALDHARRLRGKRWSGGILGNLGGSLHSSGRFAEAETNYRQALEIATEHGDQRWEGNIRSNLGLLLGERGRHAEAIEHLSIAEERARTLGHVRLALVSAWNLGIVEEARDDLEAARVHYDRALAISVALDDRPACDELGATIARLAAVDDLSCRSR